MNFIHDLFSLEHKVAAVIGGGGVLAGKMAEGLAQAGTAVAILDLNLENAQRQAASITQFGAQAQAIQLDATNKAQLIRANQEILATFGPVDILINAPGINSATPFFEIAETEWDQILSVNLKSMFLACQVFGQQMIQQAKGGSIINISSVSSGPPLSKVFTYSVSKSGVNNLTQFLAREWASTRVRVNAIAPGFFPAEQNRKILTEDRVAAIFRHTPMARFGEAAELIGAVIWLAAEKASSFVTGAIIRVDGGYTAMTI
ncbi:SDR family oxidoreductase [candidate division KSB1 bacterium]|nr:SDR family oxidoreductase [candidate division KSB1 bacterium]